MIGKKFIAVLALAGAMVASVALAETVPADIALQSLIAGNKIFAKGTGELDNLERMSTARRRTEVAAGQAPYAIILTCSDSRVPPEILFNKGLGEIFVVRVAGNIVAPHELGSIEYGIEHLGANLLMVLGHERCGAVKSTYGAYDPTLPTQTFEGNIGSLLNAIYPAVKEVVGTNKATDATGQAEQLEECIVENIKLVSEQIEKQSPVVEEFLNGVCEPTTGECRKLKIVRAKYDLDYGKVTLLP
ncbi:MAG TPA: carbonic anhydrase [Geobacteraceae bacterium]